MSSTNRLILRQNDKAVAAIQTLLLTFVTFLYLVTSGIDDKTYLVLAVLNSFIALWFMVNTNGQPFSLKMFINLFIFIFFILANAVQFANDSRVLTFYIQLTGEMYVNFQLMMTWILLLFNMLYNAVTPMKTYRPRQYTVNVKILLIVSSVTMLFVAAQNRFNPYLLFMRSLTEEMARAQGIHGRGAAESSSLMLIYDNFIRPLPWACYMVAAIAGLKGARRHLLFLLMLITVFPTGLPRNAAAMFWIPVAIVNCKKWIKGRRFLWVMIFGLFFLFPALDVFKRFSGNMSFEVGLDYLDTINFDASQIFMATVKTDLITYGRQLIGALLFFVPRKWWPDKPIGSGHLLVEENNGFFPNVSMPFFGEGYINFGFIGVVLFVIILAVVCKKMDSRYWNNHNLHALGQSYYLVLLGAVIFIMRGDMMSSFAYTIGVCVSYGAAVLLATNSRGPGRDFSLKPLIK